MAKSPETLARKRGYMVSARERWTFLTRFDVSVIKKRGPARQHRARPLQPARWTRRARTSTPGWRARTSRTTPRPRRSRWEQGHEHDAQIRRRPARAPLTRRASPTSAPARPASYRVTRLMPFDQHGEVSLPRRGNRFGRAGGPRERDRDARPLARRSVVGSRSSPERPGPLDDDPTDARQPPRRRRPQGHRPAPAARAARGRPRPSLRGEPVGARGAARVDRPPPRSGRRSRTGALILLELFADGRQPRATRSAAGRLIARHNLYGV